MNLNIVKSNFIQKTIAVQKHFGNFTVNEWKMLNPSQMNFSGRKSGDEVFCGDLIRLLNDHKLYSLNEQYVLVNFRNGVSIRLYSNAILILLAWSVHLQSML